MSDKIWEELLVWKLSGPRFDEHRGVELSDLAGLVALRTAIVEIAKLLWKARHNKRRIPDGAEEAIDLRIKKFEDGSEQATVWLGRPQPATQAALQGELYGSPIVADFTSFFDSIHEAASTLEDTVACVAGGLPIPDWFPREILRQLHLAGKGLREDERWSIHAFRKVRDFAAPANDDVPVDEDEPEEQWSFAARVARRPESPAPLRVLTGAPASPPSAHAHVQRQASDSVPLPVAERSRAAPVLDQVLRAKLEELSQPKTPDVRVVQRTLSGEVTMVDVDGLATGRLGRVRIRPDGHPDGPVEIEFLPEHEAFVTGALHKHNNRVRLRVRGDAHLDEKGRLRRFVAKRVAEVVAPDPNSFCEALFERLVTENPTRLVQLLHSDELDPTLLTFAAEIAGRNLPRDMVVPSLLQLLRHERSIVREGAIYGLRQHLDDEVARVIQKMAESDISQGVRTAAQGVLRLK